MTSPEIVAVEFVNDAIDAVVLLFSDPAENVEAVDFVDVTVIVPLFVTEPVAVNVESSTAMP